MWFKDRQDNNIFDNSTLLDKAKTLYKVKADKCGLWEVAMRRLILNYSKNTDPKKSLEEIRFLSANTVFQDNKWNSKDFLYYLDNQLINNKDLGQYDYKKQTFKNILNSFNPPLTSKIYEFENDIIPITLYARDRYALAISPTIGQLISPYPSVNMADVKIGIIFPDVSSALSALVEPYLLGKLQVMLDQSCIDGSLSLTNNNILCGVDITRITDPTYLSQRITERSFGIGSINSNFALVSQLFQSANQLAGIIRVINDMGQSIPVGYDYSDLPPNEERSLIYDFIDKATKAGIPIELEVGPMNVLQECRSGTLCLKVDLHAPQMPILDPLSGGVSEIGYVAWFGNVNFNSLDVNQAGNIDVIYTIAPFPNYDTNSQIDFLNISGQSVRLLKTNGRYIVISNPNLTTQFNSMFQAEISAIGPYSVDSSNPLYTKYIYQDGSYVIVGPLSEVRKLNSDLPFLVNPRSLFINELVNVDSIMTFFYKK